MKNFWKYLLERLNERSTWIGVITLLMSLGLNVSATVQESVINAGISVSALIIMLLKDGKVIEEKKQDNPEVK